METPKKEKKSPEGLYVVPGDPVALARARWGGGHMYDVQKRQKLMTGIALVSQHNQRPPYDQPVHVDFVFCFKRPYQRKLPHIWVVKTPDLSNLIKYYEDCAVDAGIFFDDRIICKITAMKVYGIEAYTTFTVIPLRES